MKNYNLLAIDSTLGSCSVALLYKKQIISKFSVFNKNQIYVLFSMIDDCFSKFNATLNDIDILSFSCGPGNFTGVRLSIGIMQSFSFALNLPIVSVSSLVVLAQSVYRKLKIKKIIVALSSKFNNIYFSFYNVNKNGLVYNITKESNITLNSFLRKIKNLRGRWAIAGNIECMDSIFNTKYTKFIKTELSFPHALDMISLSICKYNNGETIAFDKIKPVYLY